ncbi:hypothetical protein HAPAU_37340 [Halalkalicoccus paucihalophilus]|uniref:Uncharacterized protein n=1 Tax=Halalkalicoccus paucihalophilus TaxID=1008153 RepID=A0A151A9H9_9EURY|nr:hypothetical protein HAPAU_37340 [Halalkalicoccus paucihalophilus]
MSGIGLIGGRRYQGYTLVIIHCFSNTTLHKTVHPTQAAVRVHTYDNDVHTMNLEVGIKSITDINLYSVTKLECHHTVWLVFWDNLLASGSSCLSSRWIVDSTDGISSARV